MTVHEIDSVISMMGQPIVEVAGHSFRLPATTWRSESTGQHGHEGARLAPGSRARVGKIHLEYASNRLKRMVKNHNTARNFQRIGARSNSHIGQAFEAAAQEHLSQHGFDLRRNFRVAIGLSKREENRTFDLGSAQPPVLVECKSHTWTESGNVPSAKITVWNEAMYYFSWRQSGIERSYLCFELSISSGMRHSPSITSEPIGI